MWLIRGIILVAGIVAVVWLGTENAGTKVNFHLFARSFENIELNLILIITFLGGMLFWALFSWVKEAQLRIGLRRANKQIKALEEELADLRNLPLREESGTENQTEEE